MKRRLLKKRLAKKRYELWIGNTFEGSFSSTKKVNFYMLDMYNCNLGQLCDVSVVDTWSPYSYVAQYYPGLHLYYWKIAGRKKPSPWHDWYNNAVFDATLFDQTERPVDANQTFE